ncbi:MAG: hypothetical protein ACPL5F_10410 [Moorellaceae bacterium]
MPARRITPETVIFHLKPDGVARAVTARDMNEWERRYYRQRRGN